MLAWGNKNIVFEVYASFIFNLALKLKILCLKFVLLSTEVNNIDTMFYIFFIRNVHINVYKYVCKISIFNIPKIIKIVVLVFAE